MTKRNLYIFILALLFNVSFVYADTAITGFIPGQIWYSKDVLVEGDTVKVYTAVWNGDTTSVNARVDFYDKNVILGSRDIVVEPSHLQEVSVSWKVTAGDHVISAKISSSSTVTNGKKEQVILDNVATSEDRTFVPVSLKIENDVPAKTANTVKNEVAKATTVAKDIVPNSISSSFYSVDSIRDSTYTQIVDGKNKTQKQIDLLNQQAQTKSTVVNGKSSTDKAKVTPTESKPLDGTEKPIAYVKLFLLSVLGFIFGMPIIFYGLCAFLIFIIIRFIYRKIRNR